jgi:beta-1,4-mannosyl-glycoprotein beta-1,4-N-acetylglucosaminyltransferase
MKIFDCFTYCGEDELLRLRIQELWDKVNFFVIIESSKYHSGKSKIQLFNMSKFFQYKKKIRYFYVEDMPIHNGDNWIYEKYQRNQISKGLYDANNEDVILVSDVDEIPNLENNIYLKSDSCIFLQNFYYYKFNVLCYEGLKWNNKWPGSKSIKFKYFKNAQSVRELRVKHIPIWRIDQKIKRKIIYNGGWHFSYLMSPEKIAKKIENFAHKEYKNFSNVKQIKKAILEKKDIFSRNDLKFKVTKIDSSYPKTLQNNLEKYEEWIEKI